MMIYFFVELTDRILEEDKDFMFVRTEELKGYINYYLVSTIIFMNSEFMKLKHQEL